MGSIPVASDADLIATLVTALAIARGEPEAVVRTRFGITTAKEKS